MIAIDKLCYGSRLRYVNAGVKFLYASLTLIICIVSRSLPAALVTLVANYWLTVRKSGVPGKKYRKFMTIPLVFLLLSTLAILVNFRREPLDLFAIPLGQHYLTGSRAGLLYALRLILTALASVSCLYFLSMTTPMPDILNVLGRLHCPSLLIELMLLIYRYIFVLLDTAHAIKVSQDSRLGNRDYRHSLRSFGMLGSVLMIRAVGRSKALYDAMEARCYDGTIKVLSETQKPEKKHIVYTLVFDGLLLILSLGGFFF